VSHGGFLAPKDSDAYFGTRVWGAEGAFLRVAGYLAQHADVTIALMARDYANGNYSTRGGIPIFQLCCWMEIERRRLGRPRRLHAGGACADG
jgi:hypothetical protein